MSKVDITAWRRERRDDKSVICRIQLNYKDSRKIKTLLKILNEWDTCATGYHPRNKESILVFEREFPNDGNWKSFLRKFPFRIVETTPTDKERVYNAKKIIN